MCRGERIEESVSMRTRRERVEENVSRACRGDQDWERTEWEEKRDKRERKRDDVVEWGKEM